jgi:hypothetical protein
MLTKSKFYNTTKICINFINIGNPGEIRKIITLPARIMAYKILYWMETIMKKCSEKSQSE